MVPNKDDIVISGIGGYFPKAINVGEFKKRLFSNESLIENKWSTDNGVPNRGGIINSEEFDNSFFGIHRLQTTFMDPMHKVSLERTCEAIFDAGVNPSYLKGKNIGCYMGTTIGETDSVFLDNVVYGLGVTGHSRAMLPNRISYWLNLKGPSVFYDNNWTTGFEVINLACKAIEKGECEAAIVGANNAALYMEIQQMYHDMGFLSPDGETRAFDAKANGYARSDGCVILFLQKASDATRSYGTIMHIHTKLDGIVPDKFVSLSENKLVNFMEEFYQKCPVKPEEIDYVETYGCGIKEFDKAELNAIEKVYCKHRKSPLMIGSVKPQAGHAESCASLVALVKVLMAMEEGTIPATLSYETPNPEIKGLTNGNFEVVTTNKKWTSDYAAVNAVGVCNNYGHIVLKRNPKNKSSVPGEMPVLLPISSRTENGIAGILQQLQHKPNDREYHNLIHKIFSKAVPLHMFRGYAIPGGEFIKEHLFYNETKRPIWFVYSGMGSQWCGMANGLMKIPIFADSIRKSHETLAKKGIDLINIITSSDKTIFDNILHCFVGIASIQIALTDILKAIEIVPDGIIGHSVGELGCAYADGCMTAEQMILAAYSRGKASLDVELEKGMMAAIGLGYNQIKSELPKTIEVACHNSSESCTISGPTEDMNQYVKELTEKNIFARLVNVANIAYHSRYIRPAAPVLLQYLKEVLPQPVLRSSKWISTSNPAANWNNDLAKHSSAEYHTNNLLSAVLFEEGCQHIPKDAILIEIAPHGLLQAILKRSFKDAINIPLTSRSSDNGAEFFLQSLGKLYLSGVNYNIANIYEQVEYPVSRGTPTTSDLVSWNHTESTSKEAIDKTFLLTYDVDLDEEKYQTYVGHEILDNAVLPVSFYLDTICQILQPSGEVVFSNLDFKKHLVIPRKSKLPLRVAVFKGTGDFEFQSKETLLLTGKIVFLDATESEMVTSPPVEVTEENIYLNEEHIYKELAHRGYQFSREFKLIKSLTIAEEGSVSIANGTGKRWTRLVDAMLQQQYIVDGEEFQDARIVKMIQKVVVDLKNLEKEDVEVRSDYNYFTKMISTKGLQIFDVQTTIYKNEKNEVVLYSNDLIPLKGKRFEKLEGGIELAIKITLENFINTGLDRIFISVMVPINKSFMEALLRVIQQCPHIQINLSKHTDTRSIYVQQVYPQLLISHTVTNDELYKIVASSNALLLTTTNHTEELFDGITEVAQYFMNGRSYSLFRKTNNANICMVPVKQNNVSIQDFESPPAKWVLELNDTAGKNKNKDIYLLVPLIPQEGYKTFTETVRSKPGLTRVRFLFNIDGSKIDLNSVYKTGFYISVFKNNVSYTHISLSVEYKDAVLSGGNETIKIDDKELVFLSPNLKDETIIQGGLKKIEIGSFDYAGLDGTGKKIMGIANINETSGQLQFDRTFLWDVPAKWSFQDAASVPYPYVSAYYLMVIKGRLRPGMSILINAACSPIGLAAVAIAIQYECTVYCTVYTNQQKVCLKSYTVPQNRIFILNNSNITAEIMTATNGVGVHLVLNCLPDDLLRNSFYCCAGYGNMVHYGRHDIESNSYVDMSLFMKNLSFYVVDMRQVAFESNEIKQKLWRLVADGIANHAVVPLTKTHVDRIEFPSYLRKMKKGSNIGKVLLQAKDYFSLTTLGNHFICNPKHCYLVYGGSVEIWANVVEWLVRHGAKRVIVSSTSKSDQNDINRRLSLLHVYFEANIVVDSNSGTSPLQTLSECQQLGQIQGVFVLANKSKNDQEIYLLDRAVRKIAPNALFVNFVDSAAGICQNRADDGLPTHHVELADGQNLNAALNVLDDILTSHCPHIKLVKILKDQTPTIDVGKFLPTLAEILTQRQIPTLEADFVQIRTNGPIRIRELAPLFIISGPVCQDQISEMTSKLLYPTYHAIIPSTQSSLTDLAEIYSKKMQEIYEDNVYNLVSISTGSILLTEIARKLKQSKPEATLNIFFIDNAPNYVQEVLMQLGDRKEDIESNIMRFIFKLNDTKVYENLRAMQNWNERFKYASEHFGLKETLVNSVETGLEKLRNTIESIKTYKPDGDDRLSGRIHLIRPDDVNQSDNCGLTSYFKEAATIKIIRTDHQNITSHPDTIDYINFFADV